MRVVIGLGTNLGDRLALLRAATSRMAAIARVLACSSVYETAPVGPPQPDYLNAAILAEYTDSPRSLLAALLAIEKALGRDRRAGVRWGPRVIDLDVLWIEGTTIDEPDLKVPHPRLLERAFALTPLLEIVPQAIDPRTNKPFSRLAEPCEVLTKFAGSIE